MTPEREISNLRALLTQTLEIKLKLFDAKVEAEKERDQLRENLAIAMDALEKIRSTVGLYYAVNPIHIAIETLIKIRGEK